MSKLPLMATLGALLIAGFFVPRIYADNGDLGPDDRVRAYIQLVARGHNLSLEEAERRVEWIEALLPLTQAVNDDRDNFAELYRTEHRGEWRTVINYVGSLDAARARVSHLIPAGAAIEWRRVDYNSAYFDALIAGRAKELMVANGAAVNGVGHDVRANAVVVTTRGDQPEVEALFREALGEVVFEVGPLEASPIIGRANTATDPDALHSHGTGCNTRIDCNRWRGGIKMGQPGQNASMNMWAKRYNGSSWVYYIVFAGHADDDGGYYHNDVFVGLITRNSLWDATYENCDPIQWPTCRIETNSDSSRVFISSSAHEGLRNNWIYYESNSKAYELTYLHTSGMTAVGDPICKSGNGYWLYDSHTVCGKVISKNHHGVGQARCCADSQTIYINYLNRADFNGNYSGYGLAPGDSGAVVFSGAAGGWVGVAGPNTEGYFSRANKIEDDLSVEVCLNGDCSN